MKLEDITHHDRDNITKLTKLKSVMKYVGNGETWDSDKVDRFIGYNLKEVGSKNRREYYYKITDNKFVGIIGVHPFQSFKGYYLSVMILPSEQRKGYYRKSIEKLKDKIKKEGIVTDKIKILVRTNNKRMISLCENNYYYNTLRKIKDESFYEFFYFLRKYTYSIQLTTNESNKIAGKILEKRGNWEIFNPKNHKTLDFLYLHPETKSDKKYFKMNSLLKNLVYGDIQKITNKNTLFEELEKIPSSQKYLIANYKIDIKNIDYEKINYMFKKYKVLIFKPIHGSIGEGIEIFTDFLDFKKFTKEDLNKRIEQIKKTFYFKNPKLFNLWVLQEYIDNPLLLDGKKFHIRGYIITFFNKIYLMKHGKIIMAEENYKKKDYKNKKIHDTHTLGNQESVRRYPEDLKISQSKKKSIEEQMKKLFSLVENIQIDTKCYEESKKCYQLFGFDAMITDNYQVKLIEINRNPGQSELKIPFEKELFENQIKLVVDHVFPPKNKVDEDSDFIQVY